jgi:ketosteroid isomerase-like protein
MSKDRVVRKPIRVREQSSRTIEQRLALRVPRLASTYARLSGRLIGRLEPRSRIRQAALWRAARISMEAFNRRDLDVYLLGFQPDYEWYPPPETVEAGFFEPSYQGAAGFRELLTAWSDVVPDLRVKPIDLIDLGDRLVLLAELPGRAHASGIELTGRYAIVITLENGVAIREQTYLDHAEALEAAGLRE